MRCRITGTSLSSLFFVVVLAVLSGCVSRTALRKDQGSCAEPCLENLDSKAAGWDGHLVLEAFDKVALDFGFVGLRQKNLSGQQSEVRLWVGYAPGVTRGIILEKDVQRTRVTYLPPTFDRLAIKKSAQEIATDDFDKVWDELVSFGVFETQTGVVMCDAESQEDGDGILVEAKRGATHKYLICSNPCFSKEPVAASVASLMERVGEGLGLDFYTCPNRQRRSSQDP